MYDPSLTHQSLPSERYIRLVGIALCVFNSNNAFVIENILSTDKGYSWHKLIDMESGRLNKPIRNTISQVAGDDIAGKFEDIVQKRNRIVHSFRITSADGEQILATKDKKTQEQFEITEDYPVDFIRKNDDLSRMLNAYRGC